MVWWISGRSTVRIRLAIVECNIAITDFLVDIGRGPFRVTVVSCEDYKTTLESAI
jgi:hypothetical protein